MKCVLNYLYRAKTFLNDLSWKLYCLSELRVKMPYNKMYGSRRPNIFLIRDEIVDK